MCLIKHTIRLGAIALFFSYAAFSADSNLTVNDVIGAYKGNVSGYFGLGKLTKSGHVEFSTSADGRSLDVTCYSLKQDRETVSFPLSGATSSFANAERNELEDGTIETRIHLTTYQNDNYGASFLNSVYGGLTKTEWKYTLIFHDSKLESFEANKFHGLHNSENCKYSLSIYNVERE